MATKRGGIMGRKSIHVLPIFVLSLAVGLLGAKASALEQITHADCGLVPSFSVVWVGVDAGIFKKSGLDVTISTAQSTVPCIQSMLAGEAQLGNPETVAGLIANQNGANFVNLMNYQKTILFEMFVRNEIKTAQDLKGKKIGINRFGATAESMSRIMLKNLGLDPYKDMTFVQVGGGSERALALMNNVVQASLFSPPEPVKLAKEPTLRLLAKLSDQGVVYPYLNLVTTRKYVKERPDVIRSFVRGYLEALKFYATNKAEATEIIAKRLRIKDKELADYVHKTTSENSYMKPYVPRDAELIYEFARVEMKQPITVKWEDTYDNSFVKELDSAGFIDKLFQGVNNVIREPVAYK
jgi:ABC-type nitrate/sulfonate/bicarbonate transport system substrate-binding protein